MNFLAHIYLSGDDDYIKIGNFMADGIRGHDYLIYPDGIRKGIILHRYIDTFTDAHTIFRTSKHRLHERYGHYSGVVIDILYDHFLAKNWTYYSTESLKCFVKRFYALLCENFNILSQKTQRILPTMIEQNWLESYATVEGISKILFQMDSRTNFRSKIQFAIEELNKFYDFFEYEFRLFFEELIVYVSNKLKQIH